MTHGTYLEDEDTTREDGDRGDDDVVVAADPGLGGADLVEGETQAHEPGAEDGRRAEVDVYHGHHGEGVVRTGDNGALPFKNMRNLEETGGLGGWTV